MYKTTKSYIKAITALTGTTIGAGVFAVPYVMSKSGFLPGLFWIILIGIILIITNLLHGEFSLRTRDDAKFVGIARKYLSPFWGKFTGIITLISYYGSILAYIIIGGKFLNTLISPLLGSNIPLNTLLYFLLTSVLVYKGVAFLEKIDLLLVIGLLVSLVSLSIYSFSFVDVSNLVILNSSNLFLPYGVVLFSLGSMSAIPTVEEILDNNKRKLKNVIISSGVISIIVVALFGMSVMGVAGINTTQDAIYGLSSYLGGYITYIGALIGFLAIITSHLVISHHLKEIFNFDYKIPKRLAWGTAVLVPYLILIMTNVSFMAVISFIGGVIGGISGVLVGFIAINSHKVNTREPEYTIKNYKFWAKTVIIIFSIGILYQLYYSIFN